MVAIDGRPQIKQSLQEPVQTRRRFKIGAAHDIRHTLELIVQYAGEMVGSGHIAPADQGIAPDGRIGGNDTLSSPS